VNQSLFTTAKAPCRIGMLGDSVGINDSVRPDRPFWGLVRAFVLSAADGNASPADATGVANGLGPAVASYWAPGISRPLGSIGEAGNRRRSIEPVLQAIGRDRARALDIISFGRHLSGSAGQVTAKRSRPLSEDSSA
jgi:hypothetical protein